MVSSLLFIPLFGALAAYALPSSIQARSVTTLSQTQINAYNPYTYYASTANCKPSTTLAWNCGANCNANPGFKPVASGGDGALVQYWFVGYDPSLNTVIVSHQGTDASKILPVLTDANIDLEPLNSSLFPGISSSIQVHSGFRDAQARTATTVLAAVKSAMSTYGTTKVTVVGHSLGAAISLVDSVYLRLNLPAGTTLKTYGYGMPRVGNKAFADYVDSYLSLSHVNNKKDIVPIVPGRFLGFTHPAGEVHITDTGAWVSCSGQDNAADAQCTISSVPNIFVGNTGDHGGPYNGINMGC